MTGKRKGQYDQGLYEFIAGLKNAAEVKAVFADLCTEKEIAYMAQRLECAKMLMNGQTYETAIGETGISSATLSRVSRCIQHGSGGYSRLLRNAEKKGTER